MGDDGFREIHLDAKQLVALFMLVTVVGVVVFLCGVMVGRGARAAAPASTVAQAAPPAPAPDNPPAPDDAGGKQPATTPASAGSDPGPGAPAITPPTPPPEDLSYYGRLEGKQKDESLKQPVNPPAREGKTQRAEAAPPVPEPESGLWTVQVGAYAKQSQADAVVKHLKSKGFDVYVPTPGGDGMYKVRVGKFADRKQAETIKSRIEKEEQYKPWITR